MVDAPLNAYLRVPPPSDPDSQQGHLDGELEKLERSVREIITRLSTLTVSGAPVDSPVFTGDPQAPTPLTADNDTSIATTGYVQAQGYATTTALTTGLAGKAPTVHTHAQSDVTGLVAALAAKEPSVTASGASTDYYGGDKAFHALPPQKLVRRYYNENRSYTAFTVSIPQDDTPPLITEGSEVQNISAVTSTSTQIVRVRCVGTMGTNANTVIWALFNGSTCINAGSNFLDTGVPGVYAVEAEFSPGAAGTYVVSLRIGPQGVGTIHINGAGSRIFGGASACTMVIDVIEP